MSTAEQEKQVIPEATEIAEKAPRRKQEQLTPQETHAVLKRLIHVLSIADDLIEGDARGRIWAVFGVVGGLPPAVGSFESVDALCEHIARLRAQHNAGDNEYYIHIFYGQRWSIQKGRAWKLWDGNTLIPIAGGDIDEFLDTSGLLGDRPDLDSVVPNAAVGAATEVVPPARNRQNTAPPGVTHGPPILGEEADSGDDPDIE